MNRFPELLSDYLALRQGLGFRLKKRGTALREFIAFLERQGARRSTRDLVVRWAKLPQDCHSNWWAERFSMARDFAAYRKTYLPRIEVPPAGLLT